MQPKKPGQMDFDHFHTGIEIQWWLKKWAHDYPDLVDLYVVGESFSGQPIYQLTITNKSTGADTDKLAAFFEGNRHSGETSSAESSLWLAHHLITQACKDEKVKNCSPRRPSTSGRSTTRTGTTCTSTPPRRTGRRCGRRTTTATASSTTTPAKTSTKTDT
ncbi:M14 family zinc carboxypeptidase [Streptosporangium lutulentum]